MSTAAAYQLRIDGIVTTEGGFPFESYRFGVDNPAPASQSTGAEARKVTLKPFTITRKIDKSSPILLQKCVNGEHLRTVTLLLSAVQSGPAGAAGGPPSYITLGDVLITEINEAGNVHGGVPLEELIFSFRSLEFSVDGNPFRYDLRRPGGSIGAA